LVSVNTSNYGAEKSLVVLAKTINKNNNYKALVIIPKEDLIIDLLKGADIEFLVIPFQGNVNHGRGLKIIRGSVKFIINSCLALYLSFRIRSKLKNISVKLVHSNTITSDFGAQLAVFLSVPHIWHIREMAKITFNFDFELGNKYIKKVIKNSKKVICNSQTTHDYYASLIKHNDMQVVHNGLADMNQVKRFDSIHSPFKIILIGRLTPEKNQQIAIEACNKLFLMGKTNFIMDIWGDGPSYTGLKNLIDSKNLSKNINLKGYGKNIPVHNYCVGLSCTEFESFGRVTVEYMLGGLPVIGVKSGANREIISEKTGFLYSKDNYDEFAEKLSKLYDDYKLCETLGSNGRKEALKKFSEKLYVDKIMEIYEQS
jgi:glycosyltransferase involved in cell wall biosynthesis